MNSGSSIHCSTSGKPLPNDKMTISKPTLTHWSITSLTADGSALVTCMKIGFSVTHGARLRYIARWARLRRSLSVLSNTRTYVLNDSNELPGSISIPGPAGGLLSRNTRESDMYATCDVYCASTIQLVVTSPTEGDMAEKM